jgi:hypothetical protein
MMIYNFWAFPFPKKNRGGAGFTLYFLAKKAKKMPLQSLTQIQRQKN